MLCWILVVAVPSLVTSASLSEFLLPDAAERDISPAEDPPPAMLKHHKFTASIERLHKRESQDMYDDEDPSYQEEFLNRLQAFTAKRNGLKEYAFTIEPKTILRRDTEERDLEKPGQRSRQHKAYRFPVSDGVGEISEVELHRRERRGASSPAVDAVDENPAQWRRFDTAKPQFVTSRTQPASAGARSYYPQHAADENDMHNMRYNEIPLQPREPARAYPRPPPSPPVDYRREGEPPRRIIYYANLPEVPRNRDNADYRRYDDRYDYGRSYNKYPRESRYEDTPIRPPPGRDDRYRYRQPANSGSYSIIDAERAPSPQGAWPPPPSQPYAYRDPDTLSRYNRIPAPYQPQTGGRYAYGQSRGAPPPPPDRPNAALHPSRYNPYGRSGSLPRNQLTVTPASPALGDEPYRDYNPRQPAPWSLQIGTKLTVKDDGRQMPSPGGRRFYVQSQQQYPSRYLRSEDDPDTRQM
ncbi:uncharacterized protein [Periplaneta americana]|uniref:uncharacterized protein n=1 Tax=Periplaneta americana TaxID=6978 RepID=UPI0037E73008